MDKSADTKLPIHDLLRRRYSPVAFSEQTVSDQDLTVLFEAARWAPSCFNEQPWRFIVANRLRDDEFRTMLSCLAPPNQVWARLAGALFLTVASVNFARTGKPNRHAWHDVGQAVSALTLQAMSMDLYVHQMAGFRPDKAREVYGIPEDHEPVAVVAVGYRGDADRLPAMLRERELAPRVRKPQSEIVYTGSWGTPTAVSSGETK